MKQKTSSLVELDLASFSDIAFLLIIFFVLTTSLNRPTGRVIDMPSASKPEERKSDAAVPTVGILKDRILLGSGRNDDREVTPTELRNNLLERKLLSAPERDRMIVINLDKDVPYERYFQIVTMISETGGIIAMMTE